MSMEDYVHVPRHPGFPLFGSPSSCTYIRFVHLYWHVTTKEYLRQPQGDPSECEFTWIVYPNKIPLYLFCKKC